MEPKSSINWISSLDTIKFESKKKDAEKMTFQTHEGHYEVLVMPFGFIECFSHILEFNEQNLLSIFAEICSHFFDDILIYSGTFAQHLEHLQLVLNILQEQ